MGGGGPRKRVSVVRTTAALHSMKPQTQTAVELTEDVCDVEEEVQKLTDRFVKSVDAHLGNKEEEIMKV